MKKRYLFFAVLAVSIAFSGMFLAAPAEASDLTVTFPNGGEKLPIGSIQEITWEAYEEHELDIYLSTDSGNNYDIYIGSSSGGSFTWTVPDISTDQARIKVTGLIQYFTHYHQPYTVEASSDADFSIGRLPAAPTDLSALALSDSEIRLTWTDNADNETGFSIERNQHEIATVGADVETATQGSLPPDTLYSYRVRAFNAFGYSGYSNTVRVSTLPEQPAISPPAAPTELTAVALSDSEILLTWTDNADNETGFTFERTDDKTDYVFTYHLHEKDQESAAKDGLKAETTYTYRVRAFNAAGYSAYSNEASATTFSSDPVLPVPPVVDIELTDITGHWAEDEISELVGIGAITGYPDETYRPEGTITRAEFSSVLRGALGLAEVQGTTFSDTIGHWGEGRIEALVQAGIIDTSLYGPNYKPDDSITREEIAMMTVRMMSELTGATEIPFLDKDQIGTGYEVYVAEAFAQGIITGYPDDTFRPKGTATRAEAAVMAIRALRIIAGTIELYDVDFEGIWSPASWVRLPPKGIIIVPPSIVVFSSDKSIMTEGQSATLTWEVNRVAKVTISPAIGEVEASGTYAVSPSETTTYTLTASNVSGSTTETVTIEVRPPLILQPGPIRGKDTRVISFRQNTNYGDCDTLSAGLSLGHQKSFIQFNGVARVPDNAVIESAEMMLFLREILKSEDFYVGVHVVTETWEEETVTWNHQPGYVAVPDTISAIIPSEHSFLCTYRHEAPPDLCWKTWDITLLVQGWVNESIPNYGVALLAGDVSDNVAYFISSDYDGPFSLRPRLVITYYVP